MMYQDWEQALARAVVERAFRARLLADPTDTLADYGLSAGEATLVETLHTHTLEQLTSSLSRLTREGRWPRALAALEP
ncbi:MAG TPA: Os1348 family NHLP clan protein [Ktedonobacterales bacterium]|nr:Os1348 family NHLP clan protein [Ktedonobacterales bacterium]